MEKFIALLSMIALCIISLPAEAQYYPRTGGGYYIGPPRHAVPPPQYRPLPPPMPREPNVYGWGREFDGPRPRCCDVFTGRGWVKVDRPCWVLRAENGVVHQRPGYSY